MDAICAIDLDTILPCYFLSKVKNCIRIYDVHELFTELKEVVVRPAIQKTWTAIEKFAVPKFKPGYTVCDSIAQLFNERYGVHYTTIRNLPIKQNEIAGKEQEDFILYQGAVNESRGFEFLIPAMKMLNRKLIICGDGNYMEQLVTLINEHGINDKVELKGMLEPEKLRTFTQKAFIGISILENTGLNQYLSLQNKFFDYINAGLPQITMNFPEYKKINDKFEVAVLIDDLEPATIAAAINDLINDKSKYERLKANCLIAKNVLNWGMEEKKLINFYTQLFQAR